MERSVGREDEKDVLETYYLRELELVGWVGGTLQAHLTCESAMVVVYIPASHLPQTAGSLWERPF